MGGLRLFFFEMKEFFRSLHNKKILYTKEALRICGEPLC